MAVQNQRASRGSFLAPSTSGPAADDVDSLLYGNPVIAEGGVGLSGGCFARQAWRANQAAGKRKEIVLEGVDRANDVGVCE